MKHINIFILLLMTTFTLNAQSSNTDCTPSTAQVDLNINNVRARILGGGDMWWDLANGKYIVPNVAPGEKEVSSIFAAGLWIGGFDADGNLKLAAQTYRQTGNDFWAGPIDEQVQTDAFECALWDRHWKVNLSEIEAHITDFQDNGQIDNTIPDNILTWPGRNNPNFSSLPGVNLPDRPLAPFVDVNGDGIYQASAGDYPQIKGDQAIWWIFNDIGNVHSETGGDPLGIEVAAMAYAFNSIPSGNLNNTTFYEYAITNKSATTIHDLYVGLFVDVDLGCWSDDYVGCDTLRNMAYAYNGEATDPDCQGVNGYGDEVPTICFRILDGANDDAGNSQGMSGFVSYNNNFNNGYPYGNGNPQGEDDFYDFMRGIWPDGSPVQHGGNGYQQGTFSTPYMYPSNPADTSPEAWSECSEDHDPDDRRFIMSTGPGTLVPGESDLISYTVVWVPDVPHPCPNIISLQTSSDIVANVYDVITSAQEVDKIEATITLHPNPMKTTSTLSIESDLQVESVQVYSSDGRLQGTYKSTDNQLLIERGNLSAGIYFYEINFENGQRKGGKLIIQ